jgi:hypothetical protein
MLWAGTHILVSSLLLKIAFTINSSRKSARNLLICREKLKKERQKQKD